MPDSFDYSSSRRAFVGRVSQLGVVAALGSSIPEAGSVLASSSVAGEWDTSWEARVREADDRALFDSPSLSGGLVLDLASRYLDGCGEMSAGTTRRACAVLNIRTRAITMALDDAMWQRFPLAEENEMKDPTTQETARRNPFRAAANAGAAKPATNTLDALYKRNAIVLVCDFALGHLARRLAAKVGKDEKDVHAELRQGFVPGAYAVPSGIYGMARAQNLGCAFVPS